MKFLIAGYGSIGRRHLRNLRTLGQTDILLYRTHQSTLPDDEIAGLIVEHDLAAALAHKPDAVIISNPTALHLDVAIPSAEAGCHILMEKPVSHSLEGIDPLQAALKRGGGKLLVGFHFRYHPLLRQVQTWLNAGVIGTVTSFRAHWGEYLPNWHPWEDYRKSYAARPELGGGVIFTLTHPLDYVQWLLGSAEMVWAFTGSQGLNLPVEDTAEMGLKLKSGAVGTMHVDYVQRPPSHTLEINGSLGSIRFDNGAGTAGLYRAETQGWENVSLPAGFDRNELFLDELRHFMRVAGGQEAPICPLEDGVYTLRLALAAHQSASQGLIIQPERV
jgi:predicted dehydrogenase